MAVPEAADDGARDGGRAAGADQHAREHTGREDTDDRGDDLLDSRDHEVDGLQERIPGGDSADERSEHEPVDGRDLADDQDDGYRQSQKLPPQKRLLLCSEQTEQLNQIRHRQLGDDDQHRRLGGHGASEGDDGDLLPVRCREDAAGHLAVQGLGVEPPLAREDEIRAAEHVFETYRVEQHLDARDEPRVQQALHPGAEASGGSRSGNRGDRCAGVPLHDAGKVAQPLVEALDHLSVGALLPREDVRGALGPEERVVDVARHGELRPVQLLHGPAVVDRAQLRERASRSVELPAPVVEQPEPEGAEHAAASVVGRAAADSDQELPAARTQGVGDHLAEPEGGGLPRVPLAVGEQGQAACGGHLHHGGASAVDPSVLRLDRAHQRVVDPDCAPRSPECPDNGLGGALAAVGDKGRHGLAPGKEVPDGGLRPGRRLLRGERPLERVEGQYDFFQFHKQ